MPTSGSTAVAHFVLCASSLWALCLYPQFNYASIGFGLYFLTGVLGTLSYGVGSDSRQLYNLYDEQLKVSLCVGLPCFLSQLYLNAGYIFAAVNFVLPAAYLLSKRYFKRNSVVVLDLLQVVYLISLAYISFVRGYYYGLSTTASFLISFYAIGTSGTVKNRTPSRDLFCYSMAFSVYFLKRTVSGY